MTSRPPVYAARARGQAMDKKGPAWVMGISGRGQSSLGLSVGSMRVGEENDPADLLRPSLRRSCPWSSDGQERPRTGGLRGGANGNEGFVSRVSLLVFQLYRFQADSTPSERKGPAYMAGPSIILLTISYAPDTLQKRASGISGSGVQYTPGIGLRRP